MVRNKELHNKLIMMVSGTNNFTYIEKMKP